VGQKQQSIKSAQKCYSTPSNRRVITLVFNYLHHRQPSVTRRQWSSRYRFSMGRKPKQGHPPPTLGQSPPLPLLAELPPPTRTDSRRRRSAPWPSLGSFQTFGTYAWLPAGGIFPCRHPSCPEAAAQDGRRWGPRRRGTLGTGGLRRCNGLQPGPQMVSSDFQDGIGRGELQNETQGPVRYAMMDVPKCRKKLLSRSSVPFSFIKSKNALPYTSG